MTDGDSKKPAPDQDQTIGPEDSSNVSDPGRTIGPGQTADPDRTIGPGQTSDPGATIGPGFRAGQTIGQTIGGESITERISRINVEGYEILDELGRGGMGVVYKARDKALNRIVALKMILAGVHASDESLARFRIEAEAVAQLKHRGIVQVYDVGQADGQPYCALEFIDGGGLDDLMSQQDLSINESVAIVEELAHAMSSAHQAGIVHRDLKPANVLISTGGITGSSINIESLGEYRPKITDFGLAKKVEQESQHTQTGAIMGTPGYMAPEQARGAKRIGPAADIYSLGAILYHMVTGRPPFAGETPIKTILKVINDPPMTPRSVNSSVDRDLDTIILKCLDKEPGARYASAEHLAQDLQRYQTGMPIEARPVSGIERASKWVRRKPWAAAMIALSALGLVGVIVGGAIFNSSLSKAYGQVEEQRELAVNALSEKSQALSEKSNALEAESHALAAESSALEASDKARKRAETSESQSRRRLIDNYVNNGLQAMNNNRTLSALPWLSESLAMETDPIRKEIHQLRFNLALQKAPKPERTWLTEAAIMYCKFSDDGKKIASYSSDLNVEIRDIQENKVINKLKSPSQILAFDVTGDFRKAILVSAHIDAASGDFTKAVTEFLSWDLESGEVGKPFQHAINDEENPNYEPLVSAAKNWCFIKNNQANAVQLVDVDSHEVVHSFPLKSNKNRLRMHQSGQFIAWFDNAIRVVNVDQPESNVLEIQIDEKYRDSSSDFSFVSADRLIVSTDKVRLYDLKEGKLIGEFTRVPGDVPEMATGNMSSVIALSWSKGQLELYDTTGAPIDKRTVTSQVEQVFFSQDDSTLFVATRFEVIMFDAATGEQLGSPIPATLNPLQAASVSPDNRLLAIGSGTGVFQGNGCLRVWNVQNQNSKSIFSESDAIKPDSNVSMVKASPDGKYVAIRIAKNGKLEIHNVSNRALPLKVVTLCGKDRDPDSRRVHWATWSPDGAQIAVSLGEQVRIYAIPSGVEISRCAIESPEEIYFNSSGTQLAVGYGENRKFAAVINVSDGKLVVDGLKHRRMVRNMLFTGDQEETLTTVSNDLNYRVFNIAAGPESGKRIEKENLRMVPKSVTFSPDKKSVGVGGQRLGAMPGRIVILDIRNGKPRFDPIDIDTSISKVRFNGSGTMLAVADESGVVRILNSNDGSDRETRMTHPDVVTRMQFSSDDLILMTVCTDGKLRLFDVASGLLIAAPSGNELGLESKVVHAQFLGNTYDLCEQTGQPDIWQISDRKFTAEHASAISRFLSGSLISDRGTIVHVPTQSLRKDFSNVTIRQMMDSNMLRRLINN